MPLIPRNLHIRIRPLKSPLPHNVRNISTSTQIQPIFSAGEDPQKIEKELYQLMGRKGWKLCSNGEGVEKMLRFLKWKDTWNFMSAIAAECSRKEIRHHPEWSNIYTSLYIRWTTHNPRGISSKDIAMAQFTDSVVEQFGLEPLNDEQLGDVGKKLLELRRTLSVFNESSPSNSQNDKDICRIEDGPVVDTFRVYDIVSRNAFRPWGQFGEEDAENASTGLWIRAAYISHSCIVNLSKEFIGELMVLRVTRPIIANEEGFISNDASSDDTGRKTALMTTWGFERDFAPCCAEKDDEPNVRHKRGDLASEADRCLEKEGWVNAKKVTIMRAQRLAKAIEGTYNEDRYKEDRYWEDKYKDVPRVTAKEIRGWIAKASPRK